MSFFAVFVALLVEQLRPLPHQTPLHSAVRGWVGFVARHLDAGARRHAWGVWIVAVLLPALLAGAIYLLLREWHLVWAIAFDVVVLYLTLGFRQFSHHFSGIRDALDRGDEAEARRLLAAWQRIDASELPRSELLRQVIEHSLLAAHRHVFGVFFWFVVLSAIGLGPAGAVLYRMAALAARQAPAPRGHARADAADALGSAHLAGLMQPLFSLIDHLPARLTAGGFAIVGNFEEAVAAWRRDAGLWRQSNDGVLLAAAAGAVGVQIGASPGATPTLAHLQSLVGLVWRSVVLWMGLLLLLTAANVIG
jgi:adenosylcobinamide-phosphate synthase